VAALRAVLFDLDGTLVDSSGPLVDGLLEMAARDGLAVPGRAWAAGRIGYDPVETRRRLGAPDPVEQTRRFRRFMSTERVDRLIEGTRLLPGAREALEELAAAGLALGVATTRATDSARATLRATGLAPLLGSVVGADLVAAPKPAPDVLVRALEELGVAPPHAAMVGDTDADVGAARAAAIRCYAVLGGTGDERALRAAGAEIILSGLDELGRHLLAPAPSRPSEDER